LFLNLNRKMSKSFQLAMTVALEHYTAMLAGLLLEDDTRVGGWVEGYAQMWTWHALEETEHKAVSFDVWNTVVKPGLARYLLRTGTMLTVTVVFWLIVFDYHVRLLIADRKRGVHLRGMWRVVKFLYGPRHGVFPGIAPEWLRFFKPSYHPWDHDNRAQLARIDGLVAAAESANAANPAALKASRRGGRAAS
jgi:predicted metal-dependent hydrolase